MAGAKLCALEWIDWSLIRTSGIGGTKWVPPSLPKDFPPVDLRWP